MNRPVRMTNAAFTLIEMMIVVALFGILLLAVMTALDIASNQANTGALLSTRNQDARRALEEMKQKCAGASLATLSNQEDGTFPDPARVTVAMSDSAGSVTVDDTTGSPATGVIMIDGELMTYTGLTGTSYTGLTRGAHGTNAMAHDVDALVAVCYDNLSVSHVIVTDAGTLDTTPAYTWFAVYSSQGGQEIDNDADDNNNLLEDEKILVEGQARGVLDTDISAGAVSLDVRTTTLSDDLLNSVDDDDNVSVDVGNVSLWPARGVVLVGGEQIAYQSRTDTELQYLTRGYNDDDNDTVTAHSAGDTVVPRLPEGGGTIIIGQEIIQYEDYSNGTLTGLTRGAMGTTAAAHDANDPIYIRVNRVTNVAENGVWFGRTEDLGIGFFVRVLGVTHEGLTHGVNLDTSVSISNE